MPEVRKVDTEVTEVDRVDRRFFGTVLRGGPESTGWMPTGAERRVLAMD